MKATAAKAASWASAALLGVCLFGCASTGTSPLITLREARATLDQARHSPSADARAIEEAEGALSYAETEYRLAPGHPLSTVRAEKALEKARAALGVNAAAAPAPLAAH
ncbi:MAG: hypothetical protein R3B70_21680 [Polyangiaceae bacterium]